MKIKLATTNKRSLLQTVNINKSTIFLRNRVSETVKKRETLAKIYLNKQPLYIPIAS